MSLVREWHAMREAGYRAKTAKRELEKAQEEASAGPCRKDVADALAKRSIAGAEIEELCEWLLKYKREEISDACLYWEREGKAHRDKHGRWYWGAKRGLY